MTRIAILMLAVLMILAGCSQPEISTDPGQLFKEIDAKPNLTPEEKMVAKGYYNWRIYDMNHNKYIRRDVDSWCKDFLTQAAYAYVDSEWNSRTFGWWQKWGFGWKNTYTTEEKIYLYALGDLENWWDAYQSVYMNNLSDDDKAFLKIVHDKYGPSPVNLRQGMKKKGRLHPFMNHMVGQLEAFTGKNEFDDRDLLLYFHRFYMGHLQYLQEDMNRHFP